MEKAFADLSDEERTTQATISMTPEAWEIQDRIDRHVLAEGDLIELIDLLSQWQAAMGRHRVRGDR